MRQQVISTSVNSLCSYNMITCTSNVLKRISNGSSPEATASPATPPSNAATRCSKQLEWN